MVQLTVNGKPVTVSAAPETPLLWVLRCELGLTGTKFGCGIGVCGACTVLVGKEIRQACREPVKTLAAARVTTIEGLSGPIADALRRAWTDCDVVQCGYCQSAQLIAAAALLTRRRAPSDAEIDAAMKDIACRCGTFPRIRRAIHMAAAALR
ncbi:(2Fe-2S)-binding protein [Cupriavidus agavae]|uniref:Isoquinoline 1-oxidoreductase alpha subunit n=1 Tax=Cupriavidus agavae TaxID=1001822 RepID=A0A4Q7RUL4_9BURK|nr:(2Fe-2S)-binding protein [Cupriavidus agavae]RZT36618.1 isoquinoline 1-oxidoreductase alpha subunit [Cupriavidus agavae]